MQKKFHPVLIAIVLFLSSVLTVKPFAAQPIPHVSAAPSLQTVRETKAEPLQPVVPANERTQNATEADLSRALELYQHSDFDAAKKMLEEICQKDPKLPPPGIFLVQFAAASRQDDRIRFWIDQATWNHPDDPEAFALLAEFALNDNRFAEAKLLAEKTVSLLGNLATNEGRRKSIETFIDSVQGKLYQTLGEWDKARPHFEKLIADDSDNIDILTRLGFVAVHQAAIANRRTGYDEAIAFYQKAIDQGAKLPTPKLIVSQIADQLGKTEIADKYFNEVIKATDIDPESIRIAVQIQLRRGNIMEAEKFFQQAIRAEPNNPDNVALAGTIALFQKNWSAAEKRFQDAILMDPDSYAAAQGLALALVEQDDSLKKERALAYAKNNVQRSGESPDSVATMAWVFFKSDKQIEAEYFVNAVMQTGELTPLSAYYFAEITAAAGQTDKAVLFAKIAAGTEIHYMKKTEAEALLKRLESGLDAATSPPTAVTEAKPETETKTQVPAPIRIPGTRN